MSLPSGRLLLLGLSAAVLAAFWAIIVAGPHRAGHAGFLDPLEAGLINLRAQTFGPIAPPDDVVIVAIDDATLAAANPLGQERHNLAAMIDRIAAAGASVVAIDILLTDKGSPQGDAALARALGTVPTVIAAAGGVAPDRAPHPVPTLQDELWPRAAFDDRADVGIANISTDPAGVPRHVPILFMTSRGLQPSLAAQTAALFTGASLDISTDALKLGARVVPLDKDFQMPLRLAGPTGTVRTIPALEVLRSPAATGDLAGKAVIVGVTATGLGDRFPTPFDPALPGVEVIATAVAQLIGGDTLRRDGAIRRVDVIATVLLAALCTAIALTFPLSIGFPSALAVLALWMVVVWFAFPFGLWLGGALPLAGAGPPMAAAALLRHVHERRRAALSDRAVAALKKFQSPALAERIADTPDFLAVPEARRLVVCFVDLSGFTRLSQRLGPDGSEAFLKRFHALLAETVQERGGVILNFMGDGALLVYGVLDDLAHAADHALDAAMMIARGTRDLGAAQGFVHPLGCRIGLHYGDVVLSRMGGARQQQLTVTGDSVNLCSRLLEIVKAEGMTIAATDTFIAKLTRQPPLPVARTATFPVRGRQGKVSLSFWKL